MEKTQIKNKLEAINFKKTTDSLRPGLRTGLKKLPERLQPLLWSKSIKKLDIDVDRIYIIHQVLAYGSLEDIGMLFKIYPEAEVKDVFINYPKNIYDRPVFLFIKNFLLKIKEELADKNYVKSFFKSSQ